MLGLFQKKTASALAVAKRDVVGESLVQAATTPAQVDKVDPFANLFPSDLSQLYQSGEVRTVPAGACLFAADDLPKTSCIIIKGEAALLDASRKTVERLQPGDWLRMEDIGPDRSVQCSVTTVTDCTVVMLSAQALDSLDESFRLRLVTQLETNQRQKLRHHVDRSYRLVQQNHLLAEALFEARDKGRREFAQSEVVRQMIHRVPRLPVATAKLLVKLYDEKTTQIEVVELVKNEPSLTGMLLKVINSPVFALQHKISNVGHVVTLLGFESVYQLILSESIRKSLPETEEFLKIYHRALERAQIAFSLALNVGAERPSEISTAGLLADIGRVVLELLKSQNVRLVDLLSIIDTASLGAQLLRSWNLPEELCQAVEYARHPEFAAPARMPQRILVPVALLFFADRAWYRLRNEPDPVVSPYTEAYLQVLGVPQTFDQLLRDRLLPHLRGRIAQLPRSLALMLS